MDVREATRRPVSTIACDATIIDAARMMDGAGVGALVVVDDQRPVGIVTDRDLVVRGLARDIDLRARVDALMSTDLVTLDAAADLRDAFPIFDTHAIRRLPLLEGGRCVGVLSLDDLVVDVAADLQAVARPLAAQVLFAHPEPSPPATV